MHNTIQIHADLSAAQSLVEPLEAPLAHLHRSSELNSDGLVSSTSGLPWIQAVARRAVWAWLGQLNGTAVELIESGDNLPAVRSHFGRGPASLQWQIKSGQFYSSTALSGAMGLAESYMRDEWSTNDLTALLQLLYRADADRAAFKSLLASTTGRIARWLERLWGNTIARSRRQIAAHYDLSNEFFQLMLDPTMMYSSGYFKSPDMTLEEASVAKLDQICRKLDLQPGQELLEIGSGWGGFGLHAVSRYSAKLTTTTISRAQFDLAQSRFAAAGIAGQVELKLEDYRNLQGSFDRLVSIEMIEAVGEQNLDTYFRKCGQLLRPGGRMVIQAIVMPEQRYADYCRGVDFIQKYIFPGGFLPSITAMQHSVGRTTDWRLQNLEDLTSHYARTLLEWRRRFIDQIEAVKQLGFDDRFIRMWEYYLCYCEAAFREQAVRVVQIVWERPPVQH